MQRRSAASALIVCSECRCRFFPEHKSKSRVVVLRPEAHGDYTVQFEVLCVFLFKVCEWCARCKLLSLEDGHPFETHARHPSKTYLALLGTGCDWSDCCFCVLLFTEESFLCYFSVVLLQKVCLNPRFCSDYPVCVSLH